MPKVKHSKAGKSGKPGKKGGKPSGNRAMPPAAPSGPARPAVWRPGQDGVEEGEALEYDPSAYDCLHAFTLEWPCLRYGTSYLKLFMVTDRGICRPQYMTGCALGSLLMF
jgi:hypothetical protein